MHQYFVMLKDNARAITNTKVIVGVAMFCALEVILDMFNIYLAPTLRITFGFLATAASCYFYGPYPNMIAGLIMDFIGYAMHPDGPYFPGYALNAILLAFIFSSFFYEQPVKVWRVLVARLLVVLINYLFLNSLWMSIMYGDSFFVLVGARLLKNVIMFPIDCTMLYLLLRMCARIKPQLKL
ncbi:folate family ECF transporter S component [Dubosiella newyorkensis]|jgi:ECF transporter S component (folate family)|uniref:Folate transporter n=2 Tax=Dubosiella newyorkensis TaxID=1862672 RepID=A0A1U7NP35_9FIRM|nr:folate family ECF transporter S component [Dubosiella newyorkensis]MCI9041646.1 folate family ECF transporter S component [Dubosiella newyorkensis]OLU47212.1 hypothetical protein BO225_03595 [Dubosiella newyorkensis]